MNPRTRLSPSSCTSPLLLHLTARSFSKMYKCLTPLQPFSPGPPVSFVSQVQKLRPLWQNFITNRPWHFFFGFQQWMSRRQAHVSFAILGKRCLEMGLSGMVACMGRKCGSTSSLFPLYLVKTRTKNVRLCIPSRAKQFINM